MRKAYKFRLSPNKQQAEEIAGSLIAQEAWLSSAQESSTSTRKSASSSQQPAPGLYTQSLKEVGQSLSSARSGRPADQESGQATKTQTRRSNWAVLAQWSGCQRRIK